MSAANRCPVCASVLGSEGFCLRCALTGTVAAEPQEASRSFAGYELLGEIGQDGAMGAVYRARDNASGRVVALKMLRADRLRSEEMVRRFRLEVEAAANLDHPHVLPIYDNHTELEGLLMQDPVVGEAIREVAAQIGNEVRAANSP